MKTILLTLLLAFTIIISGCATKKRFAIPNASEKIIQDSTILEIEYSSLKIYTISVEQQKYLPMFEDTLHVKNIVRFGKLGTIQIENKDGNYKTYYSYGEKIVGEDQSIGVFIRITAKNEAGVMVRLTLTENALLVEYPWLMRANLFFK